MLNFLETSLYAVVQKERRKPPDKREIVTCKKQNHVPDPCKKIETTCI